MSFVLIVDDEAAVREVLARWLSPAGFETQEAADADAALERIGAGGCEAVLCDVTMPGHDGLWLVDRVREQHPTVAIVLATGVGDVSPSASLAENVVDYLVKPFERAAVLEAVGRARAWHETAVQKGDSNRGGDVLTNWLRVGRSRASEIK